MSPGCGMVPLQLLHELAELHGHGPGEQADELVQSKAMAADGRKNKTARRSSFLILIDRVIDQGAEGEPVLSLNQHMDQV